MSWQLLGDSNVPAVRVGLSTTRREARIRVLLSKKTMEALGIGFGDSVNVLRGSGEDAGLMRIVRAGRRPGRSYLVRPTNREAHCAGRVSFVAWASVDASSPRPAGPVDWVLNSLDGQACVDFNMPAWAGPVKFLDDPKANRRAA